MAKKTIKEEPVKKVPVAKAQKKSTAEDKSVSKPILDKTKEVKAEVKTTSKKAVEKVAPIPATKKETPAKPAAGKSATKVVTKAEPAKTEPVKPQPVKKAAPVKETVAEAPKAEVKKAPAEVKKAEVPAPVAEPVKEAPKRPDVRYSDADLEDFRVRIMDVRKEAIEELGMLKERLEDLTNYDFAEESMIYSMHMAEQGSEAMEKEKTYAQIQRINEYLKKLDEALQRIHDKTYGICRVCGCLIAKERLFAVPITTLSASYKIHKKCPDDGNDIIEPLR